MRADRQGDEVGLFQGGQGALPVQQVVDLALGKTCSEREIPDCQWAVRGTIHEGSE